MAKLTADDSGIADAPTILTDSAPHSILAQLNLAQQWRTTVHIEESDGTM